MESFYPYLNKKLSRLKKLNLYREMKTLSVKNQHEVLINGKHALNFSSNDYLGLSQHPKVIEKTIEGVKQFGVGAGASRLISGNREYHTELEKALATFKVKEACLLFGSGYLANVALLSTLPTSRDLILNDELNHASIIDGCKLSKAEVITYPHLSLNWLNDFLKDNREKYQRVFIVSDSVFSMDGDIVPLGELYELAKKHEVITIIDEAHSTGVLGECGRGIESYFNIKTPDSIIMGTLGKALGSYGAFVCGRKELIDFLINRARPFIFTTALPSAPVIAASAALELIKTNPIIIDQLKDNIKTFTQNLSQSGFNITSPTAIIPIIIGETDLTMNITDELLSQGIYIQGIRPPTVPRGTSRLRITLSATHTKEQIDHMTDILISTLSKYQLI